jgi:hypothetical protein
MLPGRPGVLSFVISGRVTRTDYEVVLLPPFRAAIANGEPIRVLAVIEDFDGLEPGPVLEQLRAAAALGRGQRSLDARFAVVSDAAWVGRGIALFGGVIPGKVRHFSRGRRADAEIWLADSRCGEAERQGP